MIEIRRGRRISISGREVKQGRIGSVISKISNACSTLVALNLFAVVWCEGACSVSFFSWLKFLNVDHKCGLYSGVVASLALGKGFEIFYGLKYGWSVFCACDVDVDFNLIEEVSPLEPCVACINLPPCKVFRTLLCDLSIVNGLQFVEIYS